MRHINRRNFTLALSLIVGLVAGYFLIPAAIERWDSETEDLNVPETQLGCTSDQPVGKYPSDPSALTAKEVAQLVGGNAEDWTVLPQTENAGWKFTSPDAVCLTVPQGAVLDYPFARAVDGNTVYTTEATLWPGAIPVVEDDGN